MSARRVKAPGYAYALAVAAGLLVAAYLYGLARLLDVAGAGTAVAVWSLFWATFAVAYAALGTAFGLMWPGRGWRWGVWLNAAPLCWVSFYNPGAAFFAGWALVSLLPSCACAYAAGRLHLRFAALNRRG